MLREGPYSAIFFRSFLPYNEGVAFAKDYLEELKKRSQASKVYRSFQLDGLEIAQMLGDEKHKALYIKLAKTGNVQELRQIAKAVVENRNVRNKGAYFMTLVKKAKTDDRT